FQPGWSGYSVRLVIAATGMALTVFWLSPATDIWLAWSLSQRVWQLAVTCMAGAGAYLALHALLGTRLRHLRAPLR
ncbi:MAG TPA: murein biosynthesis integral membrane protein MurJ, partial [Kineobactrum sp.]